MKKVLLGIIIGFVVIVGGCVALVGAGMSGVDNAVKEVEKETVKNDNKLQEMAKDIKWKVKRGDYSTEIVGIFENTSEEVIDYIEFEYKLMNSEGTVIEKSFANETEIEPGEKRKIEILCSENDFDKYDIKVKSSVF
ncbi:FxLYD domain-containing protein [Terrisporobacter glycolicus]|uniref:FxLYD domain-containing protein n=1 Tax=Terrisporobacter glycolicus TaxID=36841 RepID=UPI003463E685